MNNMQIIKAEYAIPYGIAAPVLAVITATFCQSLCIVAVVCWVLHFRCAIIDDDGAW